MKIKRYKHARRHLGFYKNVFNFRKPHLVLVDGTFTCVALRHQTNIKDQLPKYLDGEVQLLTTNCAIKETESLGKELYGAANILRRYKMLNCSHRDVPIAAAECFKALIGQDNNHHYYISTQDPELTEFAHSVPGTPLLYMNMNAIILEKPSRTSLDHAEKLTKHKMKPSEYQKETLKKLKGPEERTGAENRRKRRRAKEPNPLSVKKKKKMKTMVEKVGEEEMKSKKRSRSKRRQRLKVAVHVNELSGHSEVK